MQEEWSSRLGLERKKLTQELFELEARCRATEAALQDAVAADKNKADTIREMSNQHRSEVEAIQRAARLSSKQQVGICSLTEGSIIVVIACARGSSMALSGHNIRWGNQHTIPVITYGNKCEPCRLPYNYYNEKFIGMVIKYNFQCLLASHCISYVSSHIGNTHPIGSSASWI